MSRLPLQRAGAALAAAAFLTACGHPEKVVVDKYFQAVNAKDNQTLGSFASIDFDKKVDRVEIHKTLSETKDAAPLPEDGGNEDAPAETGRASWYELGSKTASGEDMDPEALTAAHPSLPFGTKVKVDNLGNGRSVVVRINDRGPFAKGRVIDVSKAAATQLGMIEAGVASVSISPLTELVSAEAETPPLNR